MKIFLSILFFLPCFLGSAQPITGVWRGKIINGSGLFATTGKVELKLIKKGDSLVGTSYYFNNANTYMRYSVKGYFDSVNNSVHWTDDKFLAVKPVGKTTVGVFRDPMVSEADFNCPGNNVMKLDGNSHIGSDGPVFTLHFDKVEKPIFHDEWDNVIEGYFTGMADPAIIDSVYAITKPFEPTVPDDVARQVNPVIPGQQKLPSSSNGSGTTATTAQNSKPPGVVAVTAAPVPTAGSRENETTASSSSIPAGSKNPANTSAVTATGLPAIQTGKQGQPGNNLPADTSKPTVASTQTPVETPKKPVASNDTVPGLSKEPAAAITAPVVASNPQNKPAEQTITSTTKPPVITGSSTTTTPVKTATGKPSPVTASTQGAGKAAASTIAVNNPSPANAKAPSTGQNTAVPQPPATTKPTTAANTTSAGKPTGTAPGSIAGEKTAVNNEAKPPVVPSAGVKAGLPVVATATPAIIKSDPLAERLYTTRKKISQAEIPVMGDSIELNFYDNAEIDGDSISLFLNGKLLFNHVLLSAQAYTFKIPASELPEGSELTMVAENLGTIPPNTAFMMAIVNGERYSARIESTEQTSGVIKLVKRKQ